MKRTFPELKNSHVLIAIFVISLALRLGYVLTVDPSIPIRADAQKYTQIALNVVTQGIYSPSRAADPKPDTWIAPGYPMFLTLFSGSLEREMLRAFYQTVTLAQAILSALTAMLFAMVAINAVGRRLGGLAGLLVAFSPHLIVGSAYVLTETLFITLMAASLVAWQMGDFRTRPLLAWAAFGALCGLAALVRPVYLLFPVAMLMGAGLGWRMPLRSFFSASAVTILAIGIVWSPWLGYKASVDTTPSTNQLAASFALGSYPDLIYQDPAYRGMPYREDARYDEMKQSLGSAVSVMLERAQEDPGKYVRWYLLGKPELFLSWGILVGTGGPYIYRMKTDVLSYFPPAVYWFKSYEHLHWMFVLAGLIAIVLAAITALRGRTDIEDQSSRLLLFGGAIFAYFIAIHMVLAPLPRYSVPLHPVGYLMLFLLLGELARRLRRTIRGSDGKTSSDENDESMTKPSDQPTETVAR